MEQDDNDYMDDNAEKLARKKMRTDAMKRAFAINGGYCVPLLESITTLSIDLFVSRPKSMLESGRDRS